MFARSFPCLKNSECPWDLLSLLINLSFCQVLYFCFFTFLRPFFLGNPFSFCRKPNHTQKISGPPTPHFRKMTYDVLKPKTISSALGSLAYASEARGSLLCVQRTKQNDWTMNEIKLKRRIRYSKKKFKMNRRTCWLHVVIRVRILERLLSVRWSLQFGFGAVGLADIAFSFFFSFTSGIWDSVSFGFFKSWSRGNEIKNHKISLTE
jgi:hypothetical protein